MPIFIKLITLLSLLTTSLAATVSFRYNDGTTFREDQIQLQPSVDDRGRQQLIGSCPVDDIDIYAFEILDGPDDVVCTFHRPARDPEEVASTRVGRPIFIRQGFLQFTSPPMHVVKIECVVSES